MTTKTLTCHVAICDGCGSEYEQDYTPHWPSAGEAIDDAVQDGEWWGDEKLLLCFECRHKPHTFVPGGLRAEDCERCDNPEGEHESGGEA